MEYLKNNNLFSFVYGGRSIWEYNFKKSVVQNGSEIITTYLFEDGLKVTNTAKKHDKYGAYEWVNRFENTGSQNIQIISELWDCDCEFDCEYQAAPKKSAIYPDKEKDMIIIHPYGSNVDEFDFYSHIDESSASKNMFLFANGVKEYKNIGGRSSEGLAPFFNVHQNGKGWIMAIGWTGQWNCKISRSEDKVRFRSKIEDTHFVLFPGEEIRTSSVVILPYEGSVSDSQNIWRRLLIEDFSPTLEREKNLPLAFAVWGGMKSEEVIERIEILDKENIPYEYIWMDAGWHGNTTCAGNNSFDGDWGEHVGEWFVTPQTHPKGLLDVAEKIKEKDKKFLLWFEPERAICDCELAVEHPEWMLESSERKRRSRLVNLGIPEVYDYFFKLLSDIIERLDIKCYRQDTNILPLAFWRTGDTDERRGITEIKHITALYRLWDALLEKFPTLIIDNCASGGTRLDIEMIRRSISLCRSDCQCFDNINPEVAQVHNMNFSAWVPMNATFTGRVYDTYRVRSAYAAGIQMTYAFEGGDDFGKDPERIEWLKRMCEEYLVVRRYFYGDLYMLTKPIKDEFSWCATQWDRPESGDGMVQVFRREKSPYPMAVFELMNIDRSKKYLFTDLDGGARIVDGQALADEGFCVEMKEKRSSKIYLYKIVD
ncbi:MAG: hypothetical protein E7641_00415 [Ruminococcaceae bacterium]|nr:hypothetical protein [Oscillospiraceae bacterium]